MTDSPLGARELDIMTVLWELGSGTVSEVRDKVSASVGDDLAYTTVLTILRNLEAKRFVRREEEGRAHRYFPRVQRGTAQRSALSRLVGGLFQGSAEALVTQLTDNEALSIDELQRLAKQLNDAARKRSSADRRGDKGDA